MDIEACKSNLEKTAAIVLVDAISEIWFQSMAMSEKEFIQKKPKLLSYLTQELYSTVIFSILDNLNRDKTALVPGIGKLVLGANGFELQPSELKINATMYTVDIASDHTIRDLLAQKIAKLPMLNFSHWKKLSIGEKHETVLEICETESKSLAKLLVNWFEEINRELVNKQPLFYAALGTFQIKDSSLTFTPSEDLLLEFGIF